MQNSPRSTLLVSALAAHSSRPGAETQPQSSRSTPESAWRDPTYGCVDWFGYRAADEKGATDETRV